MHYRSATLLAAIFGLAILRVEAQAPRSTDGGVASIRPETRLVQVDVVVTDRKGEYIRDLAPTECHIWEDNKEQVIASISRESSVTPASSSPTRLVLLFGRIPIGDQRFAREAAARFIEGNAAPTRLIAILNYLGSGGIKVIEKFTSDSERLMLAATNMEASGISSSDSGTGVSGVMSSAVPSWPSGPTENSWNEAGSSDLYW